ncbi:hypothetical protein GCM10009734_79490 [Nonomuraea bangladeshensis]
MNLDMLRPPLPFPLMGLSLWPAAKRAPPTSHIAPAGHANAGRTMTPTARRTPGIHRNKKCRGMGRSVIRPIPRPPATQCRGATHHRTPLRVLMGCAAAL